MSIGDERQTAARLRLSQDALVIWDMQPEFPPFGDWAESKLLHCGRVRQAFDISGTDYGLRVGMPGPCGDPLGESERDTLSLGPLLETLREFLRRAEEAGVERGAGAFREAVGLHPLIEQPVPVAQTKLTGAGLFHESLADEVLHDARHETGASLGAWKDFRLCPSAVAIREQAADNAGTLAHEDVSRLQLVAE